MVININIKLLIKMIIALDASNRTICKLTIFILFEEFIKIKNNEINNNEIKITINSKQQTHTCSKKTVLITNNDNIKTKDEESQLAILLLKKFRTINCFSL